MILIEIPQARTCTFLETGRAISHFLDSRELVHKFRHRTLLLLKALMLQKRVSLQGSLTAIASLRSSDHVLRTPCGTPVHISIFPGILDPGYVVVISWRICICI